jgi:lipoprotein-releasing system permease protein
VNLSFYIARRYLFAKKSRNAINIISGISVVGVAVGTKALIAILSVFNGFDDLIKSLYNSFDPDIKITASQGKTFIPAGPQFDALRVHPGVLVFSEVLEENALLRYGDRQYIATVKGVDDNYSKVTGIDTMIVDGRYMLRDKNEVAAVVGQGIAYYLGIGLNFLNPVNIYVIRKSARVSMNPEQAIRRKFIFPSGIFSIEQEHNSKYILVPIEFARDLLEYTEEVSALEVKLDPACDRVQVQADLQSMLGDDYVIENRYEQNELFYRIMKSEKWAIFFILTFILIVASFNIIGSLTMLILDKKEDIITLKNLGASQKLMKRIFLLEGWLISILGALIGLVAGSAIAWLQAEFGIIKLHGSGSFIIDAYPVVFIAGDVLKVFLTVLLIGFLAALIPTRYISTRYLLAAD